MNHLRRTFSYLSSHPLTSRDPVSAYWRFIKWQVQSRLRREIEFEWISGSKLLVRNGMTGATGNIYCGLHEFVDMAFVLQVLQPKDLFVDVGANVGSYTVLASAVCGSAVVAIEPDQEAARSLMRNISINRQESRVQVVKAAVGASVGRTRFTSGRDTTNRVAKADDADTTVVELTTLDDILADVSPSFLKIDVEGYENEVLKGAAHTLQKNTLFAVIVETSNELVSKTLAAAGFVRARYEPFQRLLQPTNFADQSHNALFVRDMVYCASRLAAAPKRHILGQYI